MKINKILVVRNDRFGELLLNIPAFRALRESFKEARLIIVVGSYNKDLAKYIPDVDEIIEWKVKKQSFLQKLRFIIFLRKEKIDMAVMLNPSKEFNIFTYLSGIPLRVGYNRKWGFLLNRKIADRKHLGIKHEVEYNLELVGLVGAETRDKALSLALDDNLISGIIEKFNLSDESKLIAVHPFTSDPVKQWSPEAFRNLARISAEKLNLKVILVGGKEEYEKSLLYYDNLGENVINLTGKTTLVDLAAILKKCKLLVSGDSGPVHLASSVGTPVIAIFRNDIQGKTPKRWGPWDSKSLVIEKDKLYDISVEEVLDKIKERLSI